MDAKEVFGDGSVWEEGLLGPTDEGGYELEEEVCEVLAYDPVNSVSNGNGPELIGQGGGSNFWD